MGYAPANVGSVLTAPTRETGDLDMPDNLEVIDECIGVVNDFYNKVKDIWPGDLPDFEVPTINDYIQENFTGDFASIAANGEACVATGNGLSEISSSINDATLELMTHWQGGAALGFGARLGLFSAATSAAGLVVDQGKAVFDVTSTACKELGEALAKLLGWVVELAWRVIEQIGSKLTPVVGWLKAIADGLTGFDDIKEIWQNANDVWDGIQWLLDAKGEAEAFFELMSGAFDVFNELKELVLMIPDLAENPLATSGEMARKADGIREDSEGLRDELAGDLEADASSGEGAGDALTSDVPEHS